MKTNILISLLLVASSTAFANDRAEKIIQDTTTNVSVLLNEQTVKCSKADYSRAMLKVLVPALADLTVLNHRNTREGAPCVAAGPCGAVRPGERSMTPSDVLKNGNGTDQISVRVVLKRITNKDQTVCHVSIKEEVFTVIRGIPFFHSQIAEVQNRNPVDCP